MSDVVRAFLGTLSRFLIGIPFDILGLVMVPVAYRYRDVPLVAMRKHYKWLLPVVNPEDWTLGWRGHKAGDNCVPADLRVRFSGFWGHYRYNALRNRSHGLRNYDWYNLDLIEGQIDYRTNQYCKYYSDWWLWKEKLAKPGARFWYVAWQGKHYGCKYLRYFEAFGKLRYIEFKIGWRIDPRDKEEGYRTESIRWNYGTTPTISAGIGRAGEDYS